MADYRLTRAADADLLEIFIYGLDRFGLAQAERYRDGLLRCFEHLAANPGMGRAADPLAVGARRHEHGRHIVFYDEQPYGVLIIALVHERSLRWLRQSH